MQSSRHRVSALLAGAAIVVLLGAACSQLGSPEQQAKEAAVELVREKAQESLEIAQAVAAERRDLIGDELLEKVSSSVETTFGVTVFAGVAKFGSTVELDVAITDRATSSGVGLGYADHVARLCVRVITGDEPRLLDITCDPSLPDNDPAAGEVDSTVSLR